MSVKQLRPPPTPAPSAGRSTWAGALCDARECHNRTASERTYTEFWLDELPRTGRATGESSVYLPPPADQRSTFAHIAFALAYRGLYSAMYPPASLLNESLEG